MARFDGRLLGSEKQNNKPKAAEPHLDLPRQQPYTIGLNLYDTGTATINSCCRGCSVLLLLLLLLRQRERLPHHRTWNEHTMRRNGAVGAIRRVDGANL